MTFRKVGPCVGSRQKDKGEIKSIAKTTGRKKGLWVLEQGEENESIIESFLVEYHSFVKKTIHIEELETIIVYYIIIFCTLLAKLAVNKVELFANKITVALEMCLNIICLSQKEI